MILIADDIYSNLDWNNEHKLAYWYLIQIADGIYSSELRGSDESGEGSYRVPFKTVLKVTFLCIYYIQECI